MAAWLNEWGVSFGTGMDGCVPTGTFFPKPETPDMVRPPSISVSGDQAHLQVGAYNPTDPTLDVAWGVLAEHGHAGGVPLRQRALPGEFTGPGPIGRVLARHPDLTLVIARLGTPEYGEFLELAGRYPNVHLDTTMAFTDFVEQIAPFPPHLRSRLADLRDRIVLGWDYPNIPYPYAHQVAALHRLDLGDHRLRAVLLTTVPGCSGYRDERNSIAGIEQSRVWSWPTWLRPHFLTAFEQRMDFDRARSDVLPWLYGSRSTTCAGTAATRSAPTGHWPAPAWIPRSTPLAFWTATTTGPGNGSTLRVAARAVASVLALPAPPAA